MEFPREKYVTKLMDSRGNGLIKVITGIRRVGKSYLMNELFCRRLLDSGVDEKDIIRFAFDSDEDLDALDELLPEEPTRLKQKRITLINSKKFRKYLSGRLEGKNRVYILLDEVQLLEGFAGTLNGLLRHKGYDIYVTGSNSRFLSSDIATEFRGRGQAIHVLPLTFSEYMSQQDRSPDVCWMDYIETGGIPVVACMGSREERMSYLKVLCDGTYLNDIVSRHGVRNGSALSDVFDIVASTISSLVNPTRIADTFGTVLGKDITDDTVGEYIGYFEDAFMISRCLRYDVKGRKYIGTPFKLYFEDIGIRNVRLNFR